jgi:hypothetical protein
MTTYINPELDPRQHQAKDFETVLKETTQELLERYDDYRVMPPSEHPEFFATFVMCDELHCKQLEVLDEQLGFTAVDGNPELVETIDGVRFEVSWIVYDEGDIYGITLYLPPSEE